MSDERQANNQSQAITVILHEYDSLRAEILSRASSRFQLIGYLGIAATVLGTSTIDDTERTWLIIISVVVFIGVWIVFGRYISRCATRLRTIEAYINERVEPELLVWETNLESGGHAGAAGPQATVRPPDRRG